MQTGSYRSKKKTYVVWKDRYEKEDITVKKRKMTYRDQQRRRKVWDVGGLCGGKDE